MKLFIDTNVLLDVLDNRQLHYADSAAIWTLAEKAEVEGYISAISFNNIFYIILGIEIFPLITIIILRK